jgi:hypothetical protein
MNDRTHYLGQMKMRQEEPQAGNRIRPRDWHRLLPFQPAPASDRLGWAGLEAASAPAAPGGEFERPPLTHHTLVLFTRPPVRIRAALQTLY